MSWAAVAGAAVGVVGGAINNSQQKKAASKASNSSSSTTGPWGPAQEYIIGRSEDRLKNGVSATFDDFGNPTNPQSDYETIHYPGLLDQARDLYQTTGMNGLQSNWMIDQSGQLGQFKDSRAYNDLFGVGQDAVNGGFDTNIGNVDPMGARASLGLLDPTNSMSRLLSGNVDTSALNPVINNATQRMTQNFNEQVMPGINQGAVAAGQYGGSRQGIAQGIASRGLAQSIGDMQANMYNNAFNTAQGNMYNTANNLNNQAMQNAQFNNQFQLAQNTQNLNNRVTGGNLLNGAVNGMNNMYAAGNSLMDAYRNDQWNQLAKYQSVVQPIAGLGSYQSSSTQTPYYTNTAGNILGGAATGMGLLNSFSRSSNGGTNGGGGYNEYGYTPATADAYNTTGFNW